jgi:hypothetical protein
LGELLCVAVHCAEVPPFSPAQVHVHNPLPLLTAEALPVPHSDLRGCQYTGVPLAAPQPPLTAVGCVVHVASVPPFAPAHVHVHGPLPLKADAAPVVHKCRDGAACLETPLALPHSPSTALVLVSCLLWLCACDGHAKLKKSAIPKYDTKEQ